MGGIPDVPPVRGGPLDEFWVAAEEGKLRLPRCPICREWSWYPPPTCGTDGVPPVWEEVPLTGTIFRFTVVHRSFLPPGTVERSEERWVGQECVSTCRSRWSAYH